MAINIDNVFIETFERNVRHLAQQSPTRLRAKVIERSVGSEKHNWERIGSNEATAKSGPRQATPINDSDWSRRVSLTDTIDIGDTVEPDDLVQMLVEPKSNIALSQSMGLRRGIDDIIITAATADALNGDGSTTAFLASQTVGDGTGEISLDTILQAQEIFYDNDIQMDDMQRACMVIGPKQQRKLMNLVEVTSGDFQQQKALSSGYMPNWMGFDWVVSTRLQAPSVGELDCLCFTPQGIGLQVNKDIWTKVAEDPSLSFAWRIYSAMTMGAVRVEDEHVVRLHLKDSVTLP